MILYCCRHGESAYNAEGRIQGQSNVPLSPLGRRQSEALAEALSRFEIEAVYASPLKRAYETAEPVAAALGLPICTDERLMEINAGVLQGLRWEEVRQQHPVEAARWASLEPDFVIPGGESRRQVMHRGQAALEAIRETGHQRAVVIAHGTLLGCALCGLLHIPPEHNPFDLYNGSISKLAWNSRLKLLTLNQIEHLERIEPGAAGHGGDL